MQSDPILISRCRSCAARLLAALAGCVMGGCAFQPAPELTITDTRITASSDEAFVLTFDLALRNPSDQPQELRELHYDLLVNGERVYRGRRAPLATLKGSGTQQVQLPAVLRLRRLHTAYQPDDGDHDAELDVAWSLPERIEYELRGSIRYIAPGHIAQILLDTGVRRPRIRFAEQGELRLSE